jgi:hypothetical protein
MVKESVEPRFSASVQQPTRPLCVGSKAAMSVWVGHSCPTIVILLITAVEDPVLQRQI